MSDTLENDVSTSVCANCGKEGSDVTNTCNKCKMVMYCNAACKKKHRKKHKKECERRVAEMHDEALFKQPPPDEDCPICFLRMPTLQSGQTYMACCGKVICNGCIHAFQSRAIKKEDDVCPFCRTPPLSSGEEMIKRLEKRIEMNDALAIYQLGCIYRDGVYGMPQDSIKALEFWHRAGELGSSAAYYNIRYSYKIGFGVERDEKKAKHYGELAAMGGSVKGRCFLGVVEGNTGNMDRALKHWMTAVSGGCIDSLENIKLMHIDGIATKDDYAKALCSFQTYLDEIKSDQRDEAASDTNGRYKYYESAV